MKETGNKENKTGGEFTTQLQVNKEKANGLKEKE